MAAVMWGGSVWKQWLGRECMAAMVGEGVYGSSGVGGSVWQQWCGECMAAVVGGVYGSSGVGSVWQQWCGEWWGEKWNVW